MNIKTFVSAVFITILGVTGCANTDSSNQQSGMIIGGIIGGILGNEVGDGSGQTIATIVGTLVGAKIGGEIGRSMDDTDRLKVAHSLETVRTGVSSNWVNPDTQISYKVTPTKTIESSSNPCREYSLEAIIGGKQENLYGTACRQSDGSWKIVSQ